MVDSTNNSEQEQPESSSRLDWVKRLLKWNSQTKLWDKTAQVKQGVTRARLVNRLVKKTQDFGMASLPPTEFDNPRPGEEDVRFDSPETTTINHYPPPPSSTGKWVAAALGIIGAIAVLKLPAILEALREVPAVVEPVTATPQPPEPPPVVVDPAQYELQFFED